MALLVAVIIVAAQLKHAPQWGYGGNLRQTDFIVDDNMRRSATQRQSNRRGAGRGWDRPLLFVIIIVI